MMKKTVSTALLLVIAFALLTTTTMAWLAGLVRVKDQQLIGADVPKGYFAGGTGAADDPYIIADAIHVYNLAWLQYMGYFNGLQPYFLVQASDHQLDLEGLVIPPIGTIENPFVGNFDGNNCVISNFTVSNADGDIAKRPLSVSDTIQETVEIVGFFGVIGDYTGDIATKITGFEPDVVDVYNLRLNDFHVRTESEESLMGLLAGYVNGNVESVGIGTSDLYIGDGVAPLSDTAVVQVSQAISMYSLIGAYNKNSVDWTNLPEGSGTMGTGEGEEEQGEFGGSMSMKDLLRRLTYMYTENVIKGNSYPVSFYSGTNTSAYWNNRVNYKESGRTAYLAKGSAVPLNVNKANMFDGSEINVPLTTNSSNNLLSNTYYSTHSSEDVKSSNTGYIVGGGNATTSSTIALRVRVGALSSGSTPGIYRSIGTAADAALRVTASELQMLTVRADGTTYLITDDENANGNNAVADSITNKSSYFDLNLARYLKVKAEFVDDMKDQTLLSGIRFYSNTTRGIIYDTATNKLKCGTTEGADGYTEWSTVNGRQMIDHAINFNISESGFITAIAGTYVSTSGEHSLFSLFKIERKADGVTIDNDKSFLIENIYAKIVETTDPADSTKKIHTIATYKDENGKAQPCIVYNVSDGEASAYTSQGYDKVYDCDLMGEGKLTVNNAAYYFEIPVLAGEYALGAPRTTSGESRGAYLLYLDIGANAAGSLSDGGEEGDEKDYTISGVNFFDEGSLSLSTLPSQMTTTANGDATTTETVNYGNINYHINVQNNTHTAFKINFSRISATAMSYGMAGDTTNIKVTPHHDTGITVSNDLTVTLTVLSEIVLAPITLRREE